MYSSEKNVQILIALMKKHNIKKIVISPGSANASFVASVQNDDYFELYSCVDERSAAYMACGMAEEAEEPVAICCTGATASRNYLPGLTEAFYRKLPVLAITATRRTSLIGHNVDQVIDRSNIQNDVAKISVHTSYRKQRRRQMGMRSKNQSSTIGIGSKRRLKDRYTLI